MAHLEHLFDNGLATGREPVCRAHKGQTLALRLAGDVHKVSVENV